MDYFLYDSQTYTLPHHQIAKMDEMDFMDNDEFPPLPNATEIDNIIENIEYLLLRLRLPISSSSVIPN